MWTTSIYYGLVRDEQEKEETKTSSMFINSLVDFIVISKEQLEGKDCAVCLKCPEVGDITHKLPCAHKFHKNCIVEWLKKINSCPMCRTEFPKESQSPVQFFQNNSEQSHHQNIQTGPSSPPLNMEYSGMFR